MSKSFGFLWKDLFSKKKKIFLRGLYFFGHYFVTMQWRIQNFSVGGGGKRP